jgi:hypothetical protein
MRRHHGEGIMAMRLQVGMLVWASKPRATGLSGLGLKTREDLRAARGIIEELVSRWSVFVKGLWPFNARNLTWYGYVCATLLLGHLRCVPRRHALRDHLG